MEAVLQMIAAGIDVEIHHEVATTGQGEIDIKFEPLTRMVD
jgi:glutamine synthetase